MTEPFNEDDFVEVTFEDMSGPRQDWELDQKKALQEEFDATNGFGYSPMASD